LGIVCSPNGVVKRKEEAEREVGETCLVIACQCLGMCTRDSVSLAGDGSIYQ